LSKAPACESDAKVFGFTLLLSLLTGHPLRTCASASGSQSRFE
jgi:hypothetical protein